MRKAIKKSVRFEVFKRDDFTCQYCGATPPKAILEVDHIHPVSLGGDNSQDNLATACFDCNRGKSARPLEIVPQSLADKAAIVAEREAQLAGYHEVLDHQRERIEADIWRVFNHWRGQSKTTHEKFNSVKKFVSLLGVHEVIDSVDIAMAKGRHEAAEWKYFCGVCWTKIKASGVE